MQRTFNLIYRRQGLEFREHEKTESANVTKFILGKFIFESLRKK